MAAIGFGATRVPWTVSWSAEEIFAVKRCRFFKKPALVQAVAPGVGKPLFAKPHSQRQRQAVAECLCDLCGKSMRATTKVSLSHARPQPHGAEGWAILQVEPMLHRACARESLRFCPSLKRDVASCTLHIRHVTRWRPQCAIMSEEYVESVTGERVKALGHAKIELLEWQDRDVAWLQDTPR